MTTTASIIGTTTQNTWADTIPALKIETNGDGTLTLEQDWLGNIDRVAVHPVHVRLMAERLGLIREVSASDADMLRTERGRVAALRHENDRLKRNMLRLQGHALALQQDFRRNADWDHADLSHEMNAISALVDLFDMAVDDFTDDYTAHEPGANPAAAQCEPMGSGLTRSDGREGAPAASAPPQEMHPRSRCAPQQLQLEG